MATYCECEEALANARGDIVGARKRLDSGSQQVTQADNVLANLATTYAPVATEIQKAPDETAWNVLKDRLAKMLVEKSNLKADSACAKACFAAIHTHGAGAVAAKIGELE